MSFLLIKFIHHHKICIDLHIFMILAQHLPFASQHLILFFWPKKEDIAEISSTPLISFSWRHHEKVVHLCSCFCGSICSANRASRTRANGRASGSLSYRSWRGGVCTKARREETCRGELECEGRETSPQTNYRSPVRMPILVYMHKQWKSALFYVRGLDLAI